MYNDLVEIRNDKDYGLDTRAEAQGLLNLLNQTIGTKLILSILEGEVTTFLTKYKTQ